MLTLPAGVVLPVATPAHVIAMKLLSERPTRPNDWSDLVMLLGRVPHRDVGEVVTAVDLIAARGFARGKDLKAVLRRALADVGRTDIVA